MSSTEGVDVADRVGSIVTAEAVVVVVVAVWVAGVLLDNDIASIRCISSLTTGAEWSCCS